MATPNNKIRLVSVDQPTEDTPFYRAARDLVEAERTRQEAAQKMRKVAGVHRRHRLVGGRDDASR